METYLTILYVTLEQEMALKDFFFEKGWTYCKPDLTAMTDKVGPFENPQAFRTKSGGIITYTEISENDGLKYSGANKAVNKRKCKKVTSASSVPVVKVEVSTTEDDLPSQLDDEENEIAEDATENDDGDNDDDYADDIDNTAQDKKGDTNVAEDTASPKKLGRPARKTSKVPELKENRSVTSETSSADQEEISASGRKRRRVAAKAEATIEAVMSEEKEQTEMNPSVQKKKRAVRCEQRSLPGAKLKCTICPKQYTLQYNLDRHYRLAHDPDTPPKPKPKYQRQSQQCDICGTVFSRSDILLDHIRAIHQGVPRVRAIQMCTCDVCGATFKRSTHLKEHTLVKHSGSQLPHACNMCEKSFIRHRFLEVHINRDHLKVKPFECPSCNRKFHSQFSAEQHKKMKICQSDRVKVFKCIQCEKKFPEAKSLEMHMTAKHFGGAYRCVCGKVVAWAPGVARHKRKCKAYQEYKAANGETEEKLCNIIEVSYDDVLLKNTDEHNSAKEDMPNNYNDETEGSAEQNCNTDLEPYCNKKV